MSIPVGVMVTSQPLRPLQPGDTVPDFTLPAVNRNGVVSLADYRGKCAVLAGFFRGLQCPFCRWQIAQLSAASHKLRVAGVETLAIINTSVDRAALYVRHRPTAVTLLADPDLTSHRAFGLPNAETVVGTAGSPVQEPSGTGTSSDAAVPGVETTLASGRQLVGHFLIDRTGIIRWAHVEGEERSRGASHFPGETELLEAARALLA